MATGFPVKADYATGDVLSAANMNDLAGTLNFLDPTAKGDLFPASSGTTLTRLAVGANGTVLVADSAEATGLKWAAAGSGGGMTLLSTTTLSGASTTISSIDQTYKDLQVVIHGTSNASANYYPYFKPNAGSSLATYSNLINSGGSAITQAQSDSDFGMNYALRAQSNTKNVFVVTVYNYATTTMVKNFDSSGFQVNSGSVEESIFSQGTFDTTSAITSLVISTSAGTYNAGTVLIYGVK
jgi:hypothetical protein